MASTSASSVQMVFKNDVFLSFRGEDTRGNFVDHLYDALIRKGIITYKDDETIEKGERISDQLVRSIEESRFYIIVFSKKYSDSSWCLDELVKIMECQKTKEQTAYPVFYHVEPTEIRNLKRAFGEAFQKNAGKEGAGKWRGALKEACDLAGWHLKPHGREAKVIQEIVTCISVKLHVINMSVDKNLVGMEEQIKDVVSSLAIDSEDDVRMVGIKGIGGGGKTTLARAVFDNISLFFDGISFVEDVKSSKGSGLKELQKQILASVLNDKSIDVTGVYDGKNKMKKMMPSTKALVVLDDVDDMNQLEALAGDLTWFKPGSRVIITTRDEQVLKSHQVKLSVIHDVKYVIHDIQLLRDDAAICLLSRHAFGREIPNQGYEELSRKVVDYAAGLPLAIKVLGSSLCDGTLSEWESFIQRLKKIPSKGILEILELSYDGLEDDQKQIFLDVACLLKGKSKNEAVRILESCGFDAEFGLKVLEQKSLITIPRKRRITSFFGDDDDVYFDYNYLGLHGQRRITSVFDDDDYYFYYNYLGLHDLIEEMGKDIVRRVARDEPSRHNRLWIKEEIEDILHNELGTEATRSINLEYSYLHPATIMKGLKKMNNLRFLYVNGCDDEGIDEVDQYLPNTLRSLHWFRYPFWCLPKTFKANMLVNLEMPRSNISQLWEGEEKKVLERLGFVDLHNSKLIIFDLGLIPNIEFLFLNSCKDLVELQMTVELPKLKCLNLSYTKVSKLNLELIPNIETLGRKYCEDLVELQMTVELPKLTYLDLRHSKVSKFNLGLIPNIEKLYLEGCEDLVELQMTVELPKLNYLDLSHSKVSKLNLGLIPNIETLHLRKNEDLVELQMTIELPKLNYLNLTHSKVSKLHLGLIPNIEKLCLENCEDLVELQMTIELPKLKYLDLSHSKVSKLHLGLIPNIEKLYLEGCEDLLELHMHVELLKLKDLKLSSYKMSKFNKGLTPHLEIINDERCRCLHERQALNILSYKQLELSGIDTLNMKKSIAKSLDVCPIHPKNILSYIQLHCFYDESLPSLSENLEKLISLGLCACTSLESFSASICSLQHLKVFTLKGNIPGVFKLGQLESLEKLSLSLEDIKHIPDSICMMKHLKSLELKSCWLLEKLPMDLGRLECLEELHLTDCVSLQDIPNSICEIKCLQFLDLSFCFQVKKLPEKLGRVECLKVLNIECAGISRLPETISQLKDLRIIGQTWQLESYGFTSLTEISTNTSSCYVGNYFDLNF